jgi:hypothetical protein
MAGGRPPSLKIELTAEERKVLQARARQRTAPYREVVRAQALLMAADGKRGTEIASVVRVDPAKISNWKREFLQRRLGALVDRKRPGRPRRFPPLCESGSGSFCLPDSGQTYPRTSGAKPLRP